MLSLFKFKLWQKVLLIRRLGHEATPGQRNVLINIRVHPVVLSHGIVLGVLFLDMDIKVEFQMFSGDIRTVLLSHHPRNLVLLMFHSRRVITISLYGSRCLAETKGTRSLVLGANEIRCDCLWCILETCHRHWRPRLGSSIFRLLFQILVKFNCKIRGQIFLFL